MLVFLQRVSHSITRKSRWGNKVRGSQIQSQTRACATAARRRRREICARNQTPGAEAVLFDQSLTFICSSNATNDFTAKLLEKNAIAITDVVPRQLNALV